MSRILSSTVQDLKENVQPRHSNSLNQSKDVQKSVSSHNSQVHISQAQHQETSSFIIDTNRALSSIFGNSNIYGGTFNITLHIDQPKRPRVE